MLRVIALVRVAYNEIQSHPYPPNVFWPRTLEIFCKCFICESKVTALGGSPKQLFACFEEHQTNSYYWWMVGSLVLSVKKNWMYFA
jgi:hypothetical protein